MENIPYPAESQEGSYLFEASFLDSLYSTVGSVEDNCDNSEHDVSSRAEGIFPESVINEELVLSLSQSIDNKPLCKSVFL